MNLQLSRRSTLSVFLGRTPLQLILMAPGLSTDLRQNDHRTLHPQIVMKSAYIGVDPRLCKSHPKARKRERRLRQPNPFLRCCNNESRVHAVRG